jgi:hypothetical protein
MMQNLKVLGLALLAVFAMSALAASVASAEGSITGSEETVKITATDTTKSVLAYNATSEVRCHGHYYIGNVDETNITNEIPHGWTDLPTSAITVSPKYSECEAFLNGKKVGIATVTMGTCDYVLHVGTAEGITYHGRTDIKCESGDMTIDVWAPTNTTHTGAPVCTYSFSEQLGKTGGIATSSLSDIILGGTTTGISASRKGLVCGGTSSTEEAKLKINATAIATNEEKSLVEVELSG